MAGTRKSARMSERRRREEEDEERKREDYRKRQRTLFQRKDNVIWKNDIVVDTSTGKIVLAPKEVPEDVKVKVETNDAGEDIQQLDHSEVFARDSCHETVDNNGAPISSSSRVEVRQELNASQSRTATNEQFETKLDSLKLEMEEMKQVVKAQDQKIVQLSTELETVKAEDQEKISQLTTELESEKKKTIQRLEEHGKMRKAEFELLKAENVWLVESVNQLTRQVEAIKRKSEEENNLSGGGYTQPDPESHDLIVESDREPEGNLAEGHSEDVVASSSVTNGDSDTTAANTPMIEDPDMEAVLSRILNYVGKNFQTLKAFRLVNRAWNRVSLPTWRNTAVIKLLPYPAAWDYGGIEATKFFIEYQNSQSPYDLADKPYSRYKLENCFIDKRKDWTQFWGVIGPLMEYAHFQDCIIANTTSDAFPKLLIDKMPNLKELALTTVTYDIFKQADSKTPLLDRNHLQLQSLVLIGRIKIYLDRLLVCLPSLESVVAINEDKKLIAYDDTLDKIAEAKILNPASLLNLKHLHFLNTSTTSMEIIKSYDRRRFNGKLERLANLQLKSFTFNFAPFNKAGAPDIEPFLKSQAKTLQILKFFHAPMTNLSLFREVKMTALKEIHLWGSIELGLDFLKYTPNLEVLCVNSTCTENRNETNQSHIFLFHSGESLKTARDTSLRTKYLMESVVIESLKTLHIDNEFSEKTLRFLAKWAPNLKILKTIVNSKNVSAVVEEWGELKELTCLFESKVRDWMICKDDTRPRGNQGAVISDLKKLERFQLDCSCDASKLTNTSVFNGFLKMPSLKSVQLCVSKQFSDAAEEALKQGVKSCRVIRNTGGDYSNYGCCKRHEFDLEVSATGLRIKS